MTDISLALVIPSLSAAVVCLVVAVISVAAAQASPAVMAVGWTTKLRRSLTTPYFVAGVLLALANLCNAVALPLAWDADSTVFLPLWTSTTIAVVATLELLFRYLWWRYHHNDAVSEDDANRFCLTLRRGFRLGRLVSYAFLGLLWIAISVPLILIRLAR